jgi:hypothetical protein
VSGREAAQPGWGSVPENGTVMDEINASKTPRELCSTTCFFLPDAFIRYQEALVHFVETVTGLHHDSDATDPAALFILQGVGIL